MILPIQRCLDNRSRNIRQCASNVLVDIRNTTVMLRCSNDMVSSKDWVRRSQEIPRNNSKISQNVRNNQAQPGLCWQKVKDVIDDIINHQGAGMVFLAMNSIDISEEAKVLTVITTNFVERLYEDAIEQKRKNEAKGYENHGFDTSSKSSLLFEVK